MVTEAVTLSADYIPKQGQAQILLREEHHW